ncbi:hypothetical protein GCM10011584_03840 [Nocardioides phosphati]|uniref:Sulfite exporter TauE/SafE family protein n=1 Tax=Nocardioides phosphati TaxID=1867775 RepID=A0ABQ2N6C8_9ACTN|nr:sulfite exporter TauE/SafE family protein [Nocardioides phosphati]GGO84982.1 hypothetical protein GCM10011584_03840 [Nocardioides phosphati]
MSLWAVLLTGLLAGGVSCAAVQGGLLAGLVTRQQSAAAADARASDPGEGHPAGSTAIATSQRTASRRRQLGDDLAPVAGFLGGKLASYTLVGALLGALGSAFELSAHLRATVQILAGLLIIAFGLAQLGVPGFRGFTLTPPDSWIRVVRGRARSTAALAPAVLGFAAILIPCGVTISVMAIATTTGSAWRGAATMAVFVIGTAPLFALIGYTANIAATAWKGRLAMGTGLVVLAAGLYTLNGGLTLVDSPLAARNLSRTLGIGQPALPDSSTVTMANGTQTGVITVTSSDYSPANLALKAGVPTTVVFRSKEAFGCVSALVIPSLGVQTVLPQNGDSTLKLGVPRPGHIDYSCAMGMYSGTITIG